MRIVRLPVFLLAALTVLAMSAPAHSAQPAPADDHAQISDWLSDVAGCGETTQSTADPAWFLWADKRGCGEAGVYWALVNLADDRYSVVYQRTVGGERPLCASVAAPRPVVADALAGWCSAKRKTPRLVIQYLGGMGVKPRTFSYDAHARMRVASWRGWGKARAMARGTITVGDAYTGQIRRYPVEVTASKLSACGTERDQFYLRITVKLRRKADRRRWPGFGRPKTAPCSDRAPFPHF